MCVVLIQCDIIYIMFLQGLLAGARVTLDPVWETKSEQLPTDQTGRRTEEEFLHPRVSHSFRSGAATDAVDALLDVSHLLQHLVDAAFVKLQAQKL